MMDEVTFDVEAQAAAAISNLGRYEAVYSGELHAEATWQTIELRRTIARVREEVEGLALAAPVLESVSDPLDAAAREAASTKPDRYEVGEHLAAAAHVLREEGALVGSGASLFQALWRATELLGPAGLATVGAVL